VEGPWSDPVFLNRSGFDPSLFHDVDGRKWLVNQVWKPSVNRDAFAGIVLQEFSAADLRLVGQPRTIFRGTSIGLTEGPHLYSKDGFYYLLTAEGGTEWDHAVTIARSRSLMGPYEVSPHHPLLTSATGSGLALQKSGHGSFVESQGRWYLAHLCARPNGAVRRCILGRETALQPVVWPQGEWPRLASGAHHPATSFELPGAQVKPYMTDYEDDFQSSALNAHWNTLREPPGDWLSLRERPGYLRLRGRHSLQSLFDQSLVGFRILHPHCEVATCLEFSPASFQQSAGLVMYYNTSNFYYVYCTADDEGRREIRILACDNRQCSERFQEFIPADGPARLEFKAVLNHSRLQFMVRTAGRAERAIGPSLDATILSDDYPKEGGIGLSFTGAFAALCAQDSSADDVPADFDWFAYRAAADASLNGANGDRP
jgi:xylan 1,4-beta-xylosidase